ncbi:hypothetical protein FKP32DRAFT_417759 [Trametes sanguinea]|nr:hypothetical protein FKP32DRAFT_417759 [Trametes sanguinea]
MFRTVCFAVSALALSLSAQHRPTGTDTERLRDARFVNVMDRVLRRLRARRCLNSRYSQIRTRRSSWREVYSTTALAQFKRDGRSDSTLHATDSQDRANLVAPSHGRKGPKGLCAFSLLQRKPASVERIGL